MTSLCVEYLKIKQKAEDDLKKMEHDIPSPEEQELEKKEAEKRMRDNERRVDELVEMRRKVEEEIAKMEA